MAIATNTATTQRATAELHYLWDYSSVQKLLLPSCPPLRRWSKIKYTIWNKCPYTPTHTNTHEYTASTGCCSGCSSGYSSELLLLLLLVITTTSTREKTGSNVENDVYSPSRSWVAYNQSCSMGMKKMPFSQMRKNQWYFVEVQQLTINDHTNKQLMYGETIAILISLVFLFSLSDDYKKKYKRL